MRKNDWTEEMKATLQRLLLEGKSYQEISSIMDKSKVALWHAKSRYLNLERQNQGMSSGENHYKYTGHITHDGMGYVVNTKTGKRVHREIMEKHLGRSLHPSELIHHKNKNLKDNRIENLILTDRSEHISKYHPEIGLENRFGFKKI